MNNDCYSYATGNTCMEMELPGAGGQNLRSFATHGPLSSKSWATLGGFRGFFGGFSPHQPSPEPPA